MMCEEAERIKERCLELQRVLAWSRDQDCHYIGLSPELQNCCGLWSVHCLGHKRSITPNLEGPVHLSQQAPGLPVD